MEKQFKGAIFDLDGTIVDSMGMWRSLDREFIISQGREYNPELSKAIVGMTLLQAADYFRTALKIDKTAGQIVNEWNDYLFDQYRKKIQLKRHSDKLIEKWYAEGIKMCVATLTEKDMAKTVLERFSLLDKMEFVRTVAEAGKSKKHPDIYLQCAEIMGLQPEECVVLEDTCHAMKAAKDVGFTVYAVDEETAGNKEEIHAVCDRYIMDFEELLQEDK